MAKKSKNNSGEKTNVINLDDRRPQQRMTASLLIQMVHEDVQGEQAPLEAVLPDVGEYLEYFLDLVLSEFDYIKDVSTETAKGLKGIAAVADYFDTQAARL